jgi:chromosome partitioning protein
MTKVISVINQKGGCGKTTIATNLAYGIHLIGYKTLLVDSDPQGNARDWNEANKGELIPVVGLDRETLPKDLNAVVNGYDFVVIDGAPQVAKMTLAAIKASDLVLIPVQPSPYDIWACAETVELVKSRQEAMNGKPKALFILSRVIKGTKLGSEVSEALSAYELPVMKSFTSQRVVYASSAASGKTVLTDTNVDARQEIESVVSEILFTLEVHREILKVSNI